MKASATESDEQLLIEAAQRDPSRFAELYENNVGRVYAFISRRVQDRDTAEDLTAEVFHNALANLPRFEWRGVPFSAWLLRIAANVIADRWQRTSREVELHEETAAASGIDEEVERRAMLHKLIDTLPHDQREVIMLRFVDQRSIKEIAERLGRSEGAIKQLQFRALHTLRARSRSGHE